MTSSTPHHIIVTAAIVERNGRFLVTRRPQGVHLEGLWEFPGGKCEPDESLEACVAREILEELGAPLTVQGEVFAVTHEYPERVVELHFFRCALEGEPRPLLDQEIRWVSSDGLLDLAFPPADAELIDLLRSAAR